MRVVAGLAPAALTLVEECSLAGAAGKPRARSYALAAPCEPCARGTAMSSGEAAMSKAPAMKARTIRSNGICGISFNAAGSLPSHSYRFRPSPSAYLFSSFCFSFSPPFCGGPFSAGLPCGCGAALGGGRPSGARGCGGACTTCGGRGAFAVSGRCGGVWAACGGRGTFADSGRGGCRAAACPRGGSAASRGIGFGACAVSGRCGG